ncbi:Rz1-like lysis system protein LysC [Ochrobactrum chromiisoli]
MLIGFSTAILLISGCAHKPAVEVVTKIETRQIAVPEALLTCMPEPEAREVWKSQKDVALYLIQVSEAGEDCRQKLDGVRKILDQK